MEMNLGSGDMMMQQYEEKARLMDSSAIGRALMRISHEILEKNGGAENLLLIGV